MNQVKLPLNTTVAEVLIIAKRQHKELKKMLAEKSPTLMEVQNLVARSMGFKSLYDVPESHSNLIVPSANESEGKISAPRIQDYMDFNKWNEEACSYINTVLMPGMDAEKIEVMAHDMEWNFRMDETLDNHYEHYTELAEAIEDGQEKFLTIPGTLIFLVRRKGELGYGFVYYK